MPSFPDADALAALPWQPVHPGFSIKVVRGSHDDTASRALLLRLEPGTAVARHRHTGEVHAYNLAGTRELDTGERIGPGGYVYEPPGNHDSWRAVGDEPVIVFVTVTGALEYLDDHGAVLSRTTTSSATRDYQAFIESTRAR
jgi:quercetin dioxygenase-like cupin family protein